MKFLLQYDFVILYQFEAQNVKTNALIRRSNDQSVKKIENRLEHQIKTLLSFDRLKIQSINIERNVEKTSEKLIFVEKISRTNKRNEICSKIRRRFKTSNSTSIENDENLFNHKNCFVKKEFLYKENRL